MLVLLALLAGPNVVVVMSDDQGYGDLASHGHPVLATPHLDALHAASARLVDFHVAPMCTPTRGQLLTGLDALENRAMNVSAGRTLLRRGVPTLADHLAAAGYATGLFGKWHLGDNRPFRPTDRGFGEAWWFPSSHVSSVPDAWQNDYFDDVVLHATEREPVRGYCTDVWFEKATAWIDQQAAAERPFFAYIATNAAHWPHWVPGEFRGPVRARLDRALAEGRLTLGETRPGQTVDRDEFVSFLAMIENLNGNLGRLLAHLDDTGLADDTLVVFLTDNGSTFGHATYNAGMRGRKAQLWEGGHRVPCFVRHPAIAARDVEGLTHVQDLVPTVLEACGVSPVAGSRPFDGLSLWPALTKHEPVPDRTLVINYSRMPFGVREPPRGPVASQPRKEGAAVLRGRWRWLQNAELYDLASDPLQQRNVAAEHPEVAAELQAALDAWWDELVAEGDPATPQRVLVGSDVAGRPQTITACEWLDVFIDQQQQVRRLDRKFGRWHLECDAPGRYQLELRRFPDDAGLALTDAVDEVQVTDGTMTAGPATPIAAAAVWLAGTETFDDTAAPTLVASEQIGNALACEMVLPAGEFTLRADFLDAEGEPLVGAYYATFTRLE